MKKIIYSLLALTALFPLPSFAYFSKDLYFGMRGDTDVSALQEFLADQNCFTGTPSGNFFSLTLKAVKCFQTAKGINPTGYVGSLTREAANGVLASEGVSEGVVDESGATTTPVAVAPKTNDDVVSKLNEQLTALLAQVAALQKQQEELQKQTAAQQAMQAQQAQQTERLGAIEQKLDNIKQNTAPIPEVVAPKPVEVDKSIFNVEVKVNNKTRETYHGTLNGANVEGITAYGYYTILATVLDAKGNPATGTIVEIISPDNLYDLQTLNIDPDTGGKNANTACKLRGPTCGGGYIPTTLGSRQLTIKAGERSKTITLDVE